MEIQISKLEGVRRQLETAARLYFDDGDPISIHTLVCAAYEVLRDISAARGSESVFAKDRILDLIPKEMRKEVSRALNEAQNFLKHANRDPDATITHNPQLTEIYMIEACRSYEEISGQSIPILVAFKLWLWASKPNMFIVPEPDKSKLEKLHSKYKSGSVTRSKFLDYMLPLIEQVYS